MQLPVASCPRCQREVLVYRSVDPEQDPLVADLLVRCVDCDTRLDRFGLEPELRQRSLDALTDAGYVDLDKPTPIGRGGCFEENDCEGCPKVESRPW